MTLFSGRWRDSAADVNQSILFHAMIFFSRCVCTYAMSSYILEFSPIDFQPQLLGLFFAFLVIGPIGFDIPSSLWLVVEKRIPKDWSETLRCYFFGPQDYSVSPNSRN